MHIGQRVRSTSAPGQYGTVTAVLAGAYPDSDGVVVLWDGGTTTQQPSSEWTASLESDGDFDETMNTDLDVKLAHGLGVVPLKKRKRRAGGLIM